MPEENPLQYNLFKLHGLLFGIPVERIDYISMEGTVIDVPLSDDTVRGIMSLRGEIITVLDLPKRVKFQADGELSSRIYVIIRGHNEKAGFAVERVLDNIYAAKAELFPAPASMTGLDAKSVSAIHRRDGALVPILNVDYILA